MTDRIRAVFLIILLFAGQKNAPAESKPLEMKWNELAPMIVGHRVALILTDSTTVKGYAKGSGSIPRSSLALIDLERRRGAWGRTMGTVIGVLGGMTLGGYVAAKRADLGGASIAIFLVIASAVSVLGYYAGRELDKQVTHIKVVP
jgi:hypothetical protein